MMSPLMDDLEVYSDLVSSVGVSYPDRILTPIECSDYIVQLKEETDESWEKLSKRLGLGKKRKLKTMDEPPDPTQIKLFVKLQKLSRKSAYRIRFGESGNGDVGFTIGCLVADLEDKNEQDHLIDIVAEKAETDKPILKKDVQEILARKRRAPEESIEKIIEVVMKIKNPVTKISFVIVITAREEFIEKLQESKEKDNKTNDEILRQAIDKEFSNNEISSIRLKKGTIRLIIKEEDYKNIEARWKSKKMHVTQYFNQILLEALK